MVELDAGFNEPPQPDWSLEWSATGGTVSGAGDSATFTAAGEPGWAIVTLTVYEGETALAERHCALLVYRQFAIIKADDYVSWTGASSPEWLDYLEYMNEERRAPHSVGVITLCLETYQTGGATEFVETLRALHYSGYAEVWHHGYDHQGDLLANPPWAEFFNTDFEYQQGHLETGLSLSRTVLGFPMTAFGPPFGLTDSTTTAVVDGASDLRVWMDGEPDAETFTLDLRQSGLVENPVGVPNYTFFLSTYTPDWEYALLQIHPGYLGLGGEPLFQQNFDDFVQILDYLEAAGVTFIRPTDYYALKFEGLFPLHPQADTDGDGVADFDEGQQDADNDGLPNFLDADSTGAATAALSGLTADPIGPGTVGISYDLSHPLGLPAWVEVALSTDGGATFESIAAGLSGDFGVVSPGTGREATWDAATALPGVEVPGARMRVSAGEPPSLGLEMIAVPADTFEMGSPDCPDTNGCPRHSVDLDAYTISRFEITNAEYANALDYALGQGYLEEADGVAYGGGDVFHAGEPLIRLSGSAAAITFDGSQFAALAGREAHPVTLVSWYGAAAFCNWQSELDGLTPAYALGGGWRLRIPYTNGYRLPTEAEWEYAAAWDTGLNRHWRYGFASDTLSLTRANYNSQNPAGMPDTPYTSPVGYFDGREDTEDSPSPAGLYDMSGNAAEWCQDRMGDYPEDPAVNPRGALVRPERVYRGGGWDAAETECVCAQRGGAFAETTASALGFRVARTPSSVVAISAPFPLDTVPPQVQSVTLIDAPEPNTPVVSFQVLFSETVAPVATTDFEVTTAGTVEYAPSVAAVAGDGASRVVSVLTGSMTGSLGLSVVDADSSITDPGLNPLAAGGGSGLVHSVDTLEPRVAAIVLEGAPAENATELSYSVSFTKPVSPVTTNDFRVESQGTVVEPPSITNVAGDSASCTVSVAAGVVEAELQLFLDDSDASIRDAEDRPLAGGATGSGAHPADTLPPSALSATVSGTPEPSANEVAFDIQFSEVVENVDAGDFELVYDGEIDLAPAILSVAGAGSARLVTVDTGIMEGQIGIEVKAGPGICDAAGNPLSEGASSGQAHTVDTIVPQLESLALTGSPAPNAGVLYFEALFSEPVGPVTSDDFHVLVSGTVVETPAVTVEPIDAERFRAVLSGFQVEGLLGLEWDDADASAHDAGGNPVGNTQSTGLSHSADTIAPAVNQIAIVGAPEPASRTLDFSVSFSEAAAPVSTSDFRVEAEGGVETAPAVTGVAGSGTDWQVSVNTGEVEAVLRLVFDDTDGTARDLAGNPALGPTVGPPHDADTIAPQVTGIVARTESPTNADSLEFQVVFSEAVAGFAGTGDTELEVLAFGLTYDEVCVQTEADDTGYTVVFGGVSGTGALTFAVLPAADSPGAGVRDTAGNGLQAPGIVSAAVEVDQAPPYCICQGAAIPIGASGEAVLTPEMVTVESGDNVAIVTRALDRTVFTCGDLEEPVEVELTVSDAAGNTASCFTAVTIIDPDARCPKTLAEEFLSRFSELDSDSNRMLDSVEMEESALPFWQEALAELDANGDGLLRVAELLAGGGAGVIHSADVNGNRRIGLGELLRVVQFYNSSGYHCAENPGICEDGYRAGAGDTGGCLRHASDYNPHDYQITLSELLRAVQFYNAGGYFPCEGGEGDGFRAGTPE